jgi:hypothetical protein
VTTSLNLPIQGSSGSSTGRPIPLANSEEHGDHALLPSPWPARTRLWTPPLRLSAKARARALGSERRWGGRPARGGLSCSPGYPWLIISVSVFRFILASVGACLDVAFQLAAPAC